MDRKKLDALKRLDNIEATEIQRQTDQSVYHENERLRLLYMQQFEESKAFSADQLRFLGELSQIGVISKAAVNSGVGVTTIYGWMQRDVAFKEAVEIAKGFSADRLETVANDLATGQYLRPLASGGKIVGFERIYDTKMLAMLLRAKKPQEFAEKIDVTSNGHSLVKLVDKETWESI